MTKVFQNLAGTTATGFQIGIGGPTIFEGSSTPSSGLGANGSLYVQTGSSAAVYQKSAGSWQVLTDSFSRQTVTRGTTNAVVAATTTYLGVVSGSASATSALLPPGTANKLLTVKDETGAAGTTNITLNGNGALIDGSATCVISTNYGSVTLNYSGSAWFTVRKA